MMARESEGALRPELLAAVWRRRKRLAIFVFAAAAAAVVSLVQFLPDVYQATTTVLVEGQQVPEAFVKSTVTSALDTRLQSIKQEILSRPRLEELITRYDLYPRMRPLRSTEELVNLMREHIQVELKGVSGRTTVALALSYRNGDPTRAALIANALGLLLFGAALLALGMWFSTFTKNQIIAGVLSMVVFLMLFIADWPQNFSSSTPVKVLAYMSLSNHLDNFAKGVIDLGDVVYYLSGIALGIFLTARSVDALKGRA